MKKTLCAVGAGLAGLCFGATAIADGVPLDLDPGTVFKLYSTDTNDFYSAFRGMVFIADEAITINGVALYTSATRPLNATFELYETITTTGCVFCGAKLVRIASGPLQGDLGFHGVKFDDLTLTVGQSYLLEVFYLEPADENWFFDFDPVVFGDPPVDIGAVTLIDGTINGNTINFVAPFMRLQIVTCTWDLSGDGTVNGTDLIALLGSWGDPYGTPDLIELLGAWGDCEMNQR